MAVPTNSNQNPVHGFVFDEATNTWYAQAGTAAGAISVSSVSPSTLANGQKTVTLAGTAEVLGASTAIQGVIIKANDANTGIIYVGDASVDSTNGYALRRNASVAFDIDNLDDVYIDSSVNGEGVSYLTVAA